MLQPSPPALDVIAPIFRPVFDAALRHLQQPDRQAVRALINESRRLSIAGRRGGKCGPWVTFRFRPR
jgi:hypothetical protein